MLSEWIYDCWIIAERRKLLWLLHICGRSRDLVGMSHVGWVLAGQVMAAQVQGVKAGHRYRPKLSNITAMMTCWILQHQHLCLYKHLYQLEHLLPINVSQSLPARGQFCLHVLLFISICLCPLTIIHIFSKPRFMLRESWFFWTIYVQQQLRQLSGKSSRLADSWVARK